MRRIGFCLSILLIVCALLGLFACQTHKSSSGDVDEYVFEDLPDTYEQGDSFTLKGGVLNIRYWDGIRDFVPLSDEMLTKAPDLTKVGQTTAEITYHGRVFCFPITVLTTEVASYRFKGVGRQYLGEKFSCAVGTLEVVYADGRSASLPLRELGIEDLPDLTTLGETTFTFTYKSNTFTYPFTVEISPAEVVREAIRAYSEGDGSGKKRLTAIVKVQGKGTGYGKSFPIEGDKSYEITLNGATAGERAAENALVEAFLSLSERSKSHVIMKDTISYFLEEQDLVDAYQDGESDFLSDEKAILSLLIDPLLEDETILSLLPQGMRDDLNACTEYMREKAGENALFTTPRVELLTELASRLGMEYEASSEGEVTLFANYFDRCVSSPSYKQAAIRALLSSIDKWLSDATEEDILEDLSRFYDVFSQKSEGMLLEKIALLSLLFRESTDPDSIRMALPYLRENMADALADLLVKKEGRTDETMREISEIAAGFIDVYAGDSTDYLTPFRRLSALAVANYERDDLYGIGAWMMGLAMSIDTTTEITVDYNEVMRDIPLPKEFTSVDYNKLIDKLKEQAEEGELTEKDPITVNYETDDEGRLKKVTLTQITRVHADILIMSAQLTVFTQVELAL